MLKPSTIQQSPPCPYKDTDNASTRAFAAAMLCLLLPLAVLTPSCNDPVSADDTTTGVTPDITIPAHARLYWFLDSALDTILYPATVDCVPGEMCAVISTGAWDYTCTLFPDTFWGLVQYDLTPTGTPDDTLYCHSDSVNAPTGTVAPQHRHNPPRASHQ